MYIIVSEGDTNNDPTAGPSGVSTTPGCGGGCPDQPHLSTSPGLIWGCLKSRGARDVRQPQPSTPRRQTLFATPPRPVRACPAEGQVPIQSSWGGDGRPTTDEAVSRPQIERAGTNAIDIDSCP